MTEQQFPNNLEKIPYNLDAEQAIIGALLYNNILFEKIAFLEFDHFFHPLHKKIFQIIKDMIFKGNLATTITIYPMLKTDDKFKDIDQNYLNNIVSNLGSIADIKANADHVFDLFLRRNIIDLSSNLSNKASKITIEESALNIIENAEASLFNLAKSSNIEQQIKSFDLNLKEAVLQAKIASEQNSLVGVTSGISSLDNHLGGFHKSDLLIVAGRPSMGKTALATCFGFNAAKAFAENSSNGTKVAFFSLEMSADQLALRILSQESNISSERIRKGAISNKEYLEIEKKSKELYSVPFFIDDTPALTIAGLRTRARRLKRQENIGLIIIDYLQLLQGNKGNENRVQELTEITRNLKALAKELNLPIIALSQLSRAVEQREDKFPQLADLRESGSIEQDSDVVMFVYREAYYEGRKKPQSGSEKMQEWQAKMAKIYNTATLIIAKQRHGAIGTLTVHFDENTTKFSNSAVV